MSNWISVKDRLPIVRVDVLCYSIAIDHPFSNNKVTQSYLYKMSNCDIKVFECENIYRKVTHWMPLPDPPKDTK